MANYAESSVINKGLPKIKNNTDVALVAGESATQHESEHTLDETPGTLTTPPRDVVQTVAETISTTYKEKGPMPSTADEKKTQACKKIFSQGHLRRRNQKKGGLSS